MHFETFSYFSCDFVSRATWMSAIWKTKVVLKFTFWLSFLSKDGLGYTILLILVLPVFCTDQEIVLKSFFDKYFKDLGDISAKDKVFKVVFLH